jgi:MFS family permease
MAEPSTTTQSDVSLRRMLLPLALTQFVASFAGSSMNVSITSISEDLGTTVHGVQTAITLFLLCMAALMIPGSKLTDRLGRKRCLIGGLTVYGTGALVAALAPALGVLILGYSALEGIGSALMIPPIYILATMLFNDLQSRARAFGMISGMAGVGAAAAIARRADHDGDQLAGHLPAASCNRRLGRLAQSPDRRPPAAG